MAERLRQPGRQTSWDCTDFIALSRSPGSPFRDYFGAGFEQELAKCGSFLDRDDVLKGDPAAPQWARRWQGPFTIRVEPAARCHSD